MLGVYYQLVYHPAENPAQFGMFFTSDVNGRLNTAPYPALELVEWFAVRQGNQFPGPCIGWSTSSWSIEKHAADKLTRWACRVMAREYFPELPWILTEDE
ncbi:MAG TPA: hypothetical protein VGP24_12915 [Glaciihabitans sp.]|nr:hypothetical protein [Glaciihabitans sp.]